MWLIASFLLAARTVAGVLQNVTVDAQDVTDISYSGNWTSQNDYCTSTRFASNQGDELTFHFNGVAIYAIGTVDCGWSGLLSIFLDGQATEFNRRNCSLLPVAGPAYICEYPWIAQTGLNPTTTHTLTITLTGPPIAQASEGHIIADLRYLVYTVDAPATSSLGTGPTATSTASFSSHSSNTQAIVGAAVGAAAGLAIVALVFFFVYWRKRKQRPATPEPGPPADSFPPTTWAPQPFVFPEPSPVPGSSPSTTEKPSTFSPPQSFYETLPIANFANGERSLSVGPTTYDGGSLSASSPAFRPMSVASSSSSPHPELVSQVTQAVLAAMRGPAPPAYDQKDRV